MNQCKSFLPYVNTKSKILILGSMPGIKSLEDGQYYAHPQNRFWKVMGIICGTQNLYKMDYKNKLQVLLDNKIALWDSLGFCERNGSLDSDITNEKPNNIKKILKDYPTIKTIIFNGNKSYSVFKKYFPDLLDKYNCYKMPSTSPANARYSLEKLLAEWRLIQQYIIK